MGKLIGRKRWESRERPAQGFPPGPRLVVAVTLLLRLASLVAMHIHSHLIGQGGFNSMPYGGLDDGRYYYTTAQQLADGIEPAYVLNPFPRVLAVLMQLGIRDLLALQLISFAVSSLSVVLLASLVWHLCRSMGAITQRWAVVVVSVVASLFPSNVFWTTNSLMRDGWILSFALLAVWAFSGAAPSLLTRSRWVLGLAGLVAATFFRPYTLPIFVAAMIGSRFELLNPMLRVKPRIGHVALRLTLVAGAFIGMCQAAAPLLTNLTGFNILAWRTQEQLSGKGSSMGLSFDDNSPPVVVLYYLVSFISNAVGPLPWHIVTANQTLAFVEFPFFAIIIFGLFRADYSKRLTRFCGLFGLYWLLLLGLWNDVLGNAARNRIMAWPILAIAAAPAIAQFLTERQARRSGPLAVEPSIVVRPGLGIPVSEFQKARATADARTTARTASATVSTQTIEREEPTDDEPSTEPAYTGPAETETADEMPAGAPEPEKKRRRLRRRAGGRRKVAKKSLPVQEPGGWDRSASSDPVTNPAPLPQLPLEPVGQGGAPRRSAEDRRMGERRTSQRRSDQRRGPRTSAGVLFDQESEESSPLHFRDPFDTDSSDSADLQNQSVLTVTESEETNSGTGTAS